MRKYILAALASAAVAAPAIAAPTPTIQFTQGSYGIPSSTTAQIFRTFEANQGFVVGNNAGPGAAGDVRIAQGTTPGLSVNPDNNSDQYLSIENGSYTVGFAQAVQVFSFVLGSLDSYNSVQLFFADGTNTLFTGRQIIGQANTGGPNFNDAGRVTFDLGGQAGITSAIFASPQAAFELDDFASAVPEPATWGMMILGFGVVGSQLRRRRRSEGTLAAG